MKNFEILKKGNKYYIRFDRYVSPFYDADDITGKWVKVWVTDWFFKKEFFSKTDALEYIEQLKEDRLGYSLIQKID